MKKSILGAILICLVVIVAIGWLLHEILELKEDSQSLETKYNLLNQNDGALTKEISNLQRVDIENMDKLSQSLETKYNLLNQNDGALTKEISNLQRVDIENMDKFSGLSKNIENIKQDMRGLAVSGGDGQNLYIMKRLEEIDKLENKLNFYNLNIDNVSFDPSYPKVGDRVTIDVAITNKVSLSISNVQIVVNDENGWGNGKMINFAPYEVKNIKLNISAGEIQAKTNPHKFKITLLSDNIGIRKYIQSITVEPK